MFESVKAVLFDLDGTVYYGNEIISGANEAIEHCRAQGKRVFFLTNNSTKTRQQVFDKLQGMGISCQLDEAVTSGYVSALYALQRGLRGVFICGSDSLRDELRSMGVELSGPGEAKILLIGYDPDFDYAKLTVAMRVAMQADEIIACNKERSFRGQDAELFPGCGGMVAPIEWCSGRSVDCVVGKPNTLPLEVLCREFGFEKDDLLMVGDTYESDIAMASRFGCASILVGEEERPDTVVIRSIGDIVGLI